MKSSAFLLGSRGLALAPDLSSRRAFRRLDEDIHRLEHVLEIAAVLDGPADLVVHQAIEIDDGDGTVPKRDAPDRSCFSARRRERADERT